MDRSATTCAMLLPVDAAVNAPFPIPAGDCWLTAASVLRNFRSAASAAAEIKSFRMIPSVLGEPKRASSALVTASVANFDTGNVTLSMANLLTDVGKVSPTHLAVAPETA